MEILMVLREERENFCFPFLHMKVLAKKRLDPFEMLF